VRGAARQDAQRNAARIVAAATRVLAEDPDATMQDIAAAAGLGRATVYRHFPTREDLLGAIAIAALDELRRALSDGRLEEAEPREALRRAVAAILEIGDRYRVLVDGRDHMPTESKAAAMARTFAPLEAVLERAQRQGVIGSGVPLSWVRATLGALIKVAMQEAAEGTISREDAPRMIVETLLGGLGG
jgi:TetR/AcrR family transcriptional regulator, mexCD-oprJ operon repressor